MTRKYRYKVQQKSYQILMKEAKIMREERFLTDITLQCEESGFPVHKMVLAAVSPFFKEYFIQEEDCSKTTMKINFTTPEILEVILDFCYTGRVIIDEQSQMLLKGVIEASRMLQMPLLYNYCLDLILRRSSSEAFLSQWNTIEEVNSEIVKDIFIENTLKKFASFVDTQDFLQLTCNQVYSFLLCPAAMSCDQSIILKCILNWVKHDCDSRKEQFTKYLQKVNFDEVDPLILSDLQHEPLLNENTFFLRSCNRILFQQINQKAKKIRNKTPAKKFGKFSQRQVQTQPSQDDCEKSQQSLDKFIVDNDKTRYLNTFNKRKFFIYGVSHKYLQGENISLFDFEKQEFNTLIAHPLFHIKDATIFNYNDTIYAFGGRTISLNFCTVFAFHRKSKLWLEKDFMNHFKYGASAVELNGYIYVAGGYQHTKKLKSVDRYDPISDEWESVADLPEEGQEIVPITATNNRLYTLLKTKLYHYIPEENVWCLSETNLTEKLKSEDVFLVKGSGKVYIIEKCLPKNVWIFDPINNLLSSDIVPAELSQCDGMLNLENPELLEILVSGNGKWFIYKPMNSWHSFDCEQLNDIKISMMTLIHS